MNFQRFGGRAATDTHTYLYTDQKENNNNNKYNRKKTHNIFLNNVLGWQML